MATTMMVGIDGSEGARRAVEFAAVRAKIFKARLILVCVIEWSPYRFLTPEELETRSRDREAEIGRAKTQVVDPVLQSLEGSGLEVEAVVRHGKPAMVLKELSQEYKVDQLFIGRVGRSKIANVLFGSVASMLVQTAAVPVTIVP